jgi:hypothetical protein
MIETLQFIVMLGVERHGSIHLPSYSVRIDDTIIEAKTIPDFKTNDSFPVSFEITLEPGPHTLFVEYDNLEKRGLMRVENIYVGTDKGGVSFEQIVTSHSTEKSNILKGHSVYSFSFTSPLFYWALLNTEI